MTNILNDNSREIQVVEDGLSMLHNRRPLPLYKRWYYKIKRGMQKVRYFPAEIKYFIQRGRRGYADCDYWNMDHYFSNIGANLVAKMHDRGHGYPADMTIEDWNESLIRVALAFAVIRDCQDLCHYDMKRMSTKEAVDLENERVEAAQEILTNDFVKRILSFWD